MERFSVDGGELEFEVTGEGQPAVFIHGSHITDAFAPLCQVSMLYGYQLVRYHRRGFAGSTKCAEPVSIVRQAQDCEALFAHLGLERAHVVGHSYGGAIGLQLAAQAPSLIQTLTLAEPALLGVPSGEAALGEVLAAAEQYGRGDHEGAVYAFMRWVSRADGPDIVDRIIPGGMAQAVKDADTFFEIELPALAEWQFSSDDIRGFEQPVLYLLGADSLAAFQEGPDLIRSWLPQTELVRLAGTSHLLQMESPTSCGNALADFFERHPIG